MRNRRVGVCSLQILAAGSEMAQSAYAIFSAVGWLAGHGASILRRPGGFAILTGSRAAGGTAVTTAAVTPLARRRDGYGIAVRERVEGETRNRHA